MATKGTGVQSCQDNITAEMAFIDYKTEMKDRSGEFDCFCDKVYHDDGYSAMIDYKFDLDPE